jgi:hypothetical protein
MKSKKKYIGIFIYGTMIIPIIFVIFWEIGLGILFGVGGALRANKISGKLLYKTDHQMLLKAGREILSQVPCTNNNTEGVHKYPIPNEVKIPKMIQDMKPRAILMSSYGYLEIRMHGGMDHFGVYIYPEDFNVPFPNFPYGDQKLTEGLWYYDDE